MFNFLLLFSVGGTGYCILELLWRGHTHWTMFFLGGFCFFMLFTLFTRFQDMTFLIKIIIGGLIITVSEFFTGLLVNVILGWNVWSYANTPFNLLGQICLLYSFLWTLLCIPLAYLCPIVKKYIG